jgi:hypothetical protein
MERSFIKSPWFFTCIGKCPVICRGRRGCKKLKKETERGIIRQRQEKVEMQWERKGNRRK